jgi:hypothetical protein
LPFMNCFIQFSQGRLRICTTRTKRSPGNTAKRQRASHNSRGGCPERSRRPCDAPSPRRTLTCAVPRRAAGASIYFFARSP